jgi:hypothetical protein
MKRKRLRKQNKEKKSIFFFSFNKREDALTFYFHVKKRMKTRTMEVSDGAVTERKRE